MRGCITRRGKSSWRLKFDVESRAGERQIRYVTVKGKRAHAEAELARLLNEAHRGTLVDPTTVTVADYFRGWLSDKADLTPATRETYEHDIEKRIIPVLGALELQKLKPKHVQDWLSGMTRAGLSARTVRHAYVILTMGLKQAFRLEIVNRNVADAVTPPRLKAKEVEILTPEQITAVRDALCGSRLGPIAELGLASGARLGELLALRWKDLADGTIIIERAIEVTRAGVRFKEPKSEHGRRQISLHAGAVQALEQLRHHGGISMHPEALIFSNADGSPIRPNNISVQWSRAIRKIPGVPPVTFHALRHTHASALIKGGIDVVTVSRRLGHSSAVITLKIYAHLFGAPGAGACAQAIERMMG
jgi:integrase